MPAAFTEILQREDEIEIINKQITGQPRDARAIGIQTTKEMDLFRYSSNYQECSGGMGDLHTETGIIFDDPQEDY